MAQGRAAREQPPPGDLIVNQDDVDAINTILGVNCFADCTGDGSVDTQDFLCFQNLWSTGCQADRALQESFRAHAPG